MNVVEKLKKRGLVRAHGVSSHTLVGITRCIDEPWVETVHARINPYAVSMDVKTIEEVPKVVKVLKAIRKKGKAVIGMKIVGEGKFGNSPEKLDNSIQFALESGCTDAMVVGFEKVEEIDDFAMRARKVTVGQGVSNITSMVA
jgi:predicted aldo/keto reductase-like oxidoreductase